MKCVFPPLRLSALMLASALGCSESSGEQPILVGASLALTGSAGRKELQASADLAFKQINAAGGIAGRPIELVVLDNQTDVNGRTATHVDEFANRDDIVAVLGPDLPDGFESVLPQLAETETVLVSGRLVASALQGDLADDGYMFRTNSDEDQWAEVTAHFGMTLAEPRMDDIVIVEMPFRNSRELTAALRRSFEARGAVVRVIAHGFFDTGPVVWENLRALNPKTVLLPILPNYAANLIVAWDDSSTLGDLRWFFTPLTGDLATLSARAGRVDGMFGHSPSHSIGAPWEEFKTLFTEETGLNPSFDSQGFSAFFDAANFLALGLARQAATSPGAQLGGAGLRDALRGLSDPAGTLIRASQWTDAMALIDQGLPINYEGASGPVDMDAHGDTVQPQTIYRVEADDNGGSLTLVEEHRFESTWTAP